MDVIDVLCAQLTRDLFAIAKFLFWRVIAFGNYDDYGINVYMFSRSNKACFCFEQITRLLSQRGRAMLRVCQ